MNDDFHSSIAQAKQQRSTELDVLEAIIEYIPYACLLVDDRSGHILLANTHAAELTLYTKRELAGSDTSPLWTIQSEKAALSPLPPGHSTTPGSEVQKGILIRRDLTRLPIQIQITHLPGRGLRSLIVLKTSQGHTGPDQPSITPGIISELNTVVEAILQDEEDTSVNQILQTAARLSGADLIIVYRAMPDQPLLQRYSATGVADLLPERLTAQELSYLLKPRLWAGSKRPSCSLHRAALSSGLSYLVSTPIGPPHALIGLLVLANSQPGPAEFAVQVAQLVATSLAVVIQQSAHKSAYQAYIEQLAGRLHVGTMLLENTVEGILVVDSDLNVTHSNLAAETMFGYSQREMAGQPVSNILIGTESLYRALEAIHQGSSTYNLGNEHLYRRNGQSFLALIRLFSIQHADHFKGILIFVQDFSEHEQIQLQSLHLEQQANLGEIIAIFAHEVRNPINNISTGLQLMSYNQPEDAASQEPIQRMLQDCDRLEELVKSVLAFSRPTEYEMEILDLGTVLQRQLDRTRLRIEKLNIRCNLQLEPGYPLIWGNLRALEQVFSNLINNAVQAMSESGGSLVIRIAPGRTVEGRSYTEVSITDTGPGIPSEHQERIFQPFFTTKPGGTGLGLPIAKRIVTVHKGTIQVTSFPGGTVFQVRFPAANP